jgi:iron complex transport system permease protein
MLGGFTTASWDKIKILTIPIVLTFIIIFFYLRELNILTLGDKRATQLGVNVERIKRILLILASILASLGVAIGGLIAFIGLITPHIMRLIVGSDNRILYPTSALTGSIILIFSDTIARTITSPREIPVGIITAVIGAPYFLYLMKTKGREIFK